MKIFYVKVNIKDLIGSLSSVTVILIMLLAVGICSAGDEPRVFSDEDLKGYSSGLVRDEQTVHRLTAPTMSGDHVDRANASLRNSTGYKIPSKKKILALLKDERYLEIEEILAKAEADYARDLNAEWCYFQTYATFFDVDTGLANRLDIWARASSKPYMAYAAKGLYQQRQGFKSRGGQYAGDTPQWKFDRMKGHFTEALRNLQKALSLNPRFTVGHASLIMIYRGLGDQESARKALSEALKVNPLTYFTRAQYMVMLQPRWGGSYEEMEFFARESLKYLADNPRLWTLQGDAAADRADVYAMEGAYDKAVDEYTKALGFGDRISWLKQRAELYMKRSEFKLAFDDYNKILDYEPDNDEIRKIVEPTRKLKKQ